MKRNILYLFLAMLCFVGIILIFVFDGYIGIYDSLVMDNGRFPQNIEADQWGDTRYDYARSAYIERGDRMEFTYTVENHRFSTYQEEVTVSFRRGDEEIMAPLSYAVAAAPFDNTEVSWVLADVAEIVPEDYPSEQSYNFDIIISRGAVERKINVNISGLPSKEIITVPAR